MISTLSFCGDTSSSDLEIALRRTAHHPIVHSITYLLALLNTNLSIYYLALRNKKKCTGEEQPLQYTYIV
jgi:hypothetical protein